MKLFCNHDDDFISLSDNWDEFRNIMINTTIQKQRDMAYAYFGYIESAPLTLYGHSPYKDKKMLHPLKFALNYLKES